MSSEHANSLPPPPPPPPPPAPTSSPRVGVGQTSPLRRIAVQPPIITTALVPQQGAYLHSQTPASATALSLPFSPYAPSPSTYAASPISSPMALRGASPMVSAYNPQQWGRNGPVGGAYMPHSNTQTPTATQRPQDLTGMEAAMPSPPPPYSPAQGQSMSQAVHASPHMSSNTFRSPQTATNSPTPSEYTPAAPQRTSSGYSYSRPTSMTVPTSATSTTSVANFPPPPPQNSRDRSASRPRLDKSHSKFSLSSLTGRNRTPEQNAGPSAIESLRLNTSEALSRTPLNAAPVPRGPQPYLANAAPDRRWSPDSPARAPASRRAASTGGIGLPSSSGRTPIEQSPSPAQGNWEPGMPLPPPPACPPPSGSRSQSMSRTPDSFTRGEGSLPAAPPTRRPPQQGTTLAPIPATPVGWQDEDIRARSRSPAARGLHIDTSSHSINPRTQTVQPLGTESAFISSGPTSSTAVSGHSNSAGALSRTPAKRDTSARGIRERRSESRAARERATSSGYSTVEPNNNPWAQDMDSASTKPVDLVLANSTTDSSLSRRRGVTKGTPRSGREFSSPRNSLLLSGGQISTEELRDPGSTSSTPRIDSARRVVSPENFAPTPPFSPGHGRFDRVHLQKASPAVPPKALPTPPPQHLSDSPFSGLSPASQSSVRPISHILHTPNVESVTMPRPLSPARPVSAGLSTSTPKPSTRDMFAQSAIERHKSFVEREMAAETDQERLELFADFIVSESRLRRDRYSAAFDQMAGEILELTRDLWRPYGNTGRKATTPVSSAKAPPSGRRSQASNTGGSPDAHFNSMPTSAASPASSVANYTSHTEPTSPSSAGSQSQGHGRDQTWNSFQPCLSPIPSMAMSTVPDEEDSRGRSASRWWEASVSGTSDGRGGKRLERSKRESKYMSLPKEARENLQWQDEGSPAYTAGPSNYSYGPNDYPPEKTGLHDQDQPASARSFTVYASSAPATPDPYKLDVSRLVTLPPPYPRHHPAVNNNHPDLTPIRTNLRALLDLADAKTTKDRYLAKINVRREQERTSAAEKRKEIRYNIQENVRNSIMSFADAAKAESDFDARANKRTLDMVQSEFDIFQTEVASPLHALLSERVRKATASIEHIKGSLFEEARELDPNQTQEEGDEQPELLEKLTLLKWLFEAREQLHKEMFELEDERNDRYKHIVLTPYVQTGNDEKIKEAEDFFRRDAQDRKVVFEKEALKRYEEFMNTVERNVTRGVELQLSAFWDIAPGLLAVVQKVPTILDGFEVLIPPMEYEENPAYYKFPMQYLYSLLAHAGRSAYQFIESQTNLLCLLHEVKTGVMTAGSRLLETQRYLAGEDFATIDKEMKAVRQDEEARLTEDLKEKVGLVEGQWNEALGKRLGDCKSRVETFLIRQGGWDESLQE